MSAKPELRGRNDTHLRWFKLGPTRQPALNNLSCRSGYQFRETHHLNLNWVRLNSRGCSPRRALGSGTGAGCSGLALPLFHAVCALLEGASAGGARDAEAWAPRQLLTRGPARGLFPWLGLLFGEGASHGEGPGSRPSSTASEQGCPALPAVLCRGAVTARRASRRPQRPHLSAGRGSVALGPGFKLPPESLRPLSSRSEHSLTHAFLTQAHTSVPSLGREG